MCQIELTNDYWDIQLPNQLATSGAVTASLYAYHAAQVVLDAPVLFSRVKVANLLDPSQRAPKTALERHHLYPKDYLNSLGVNDTKLVNQIANFAMIEWPENLKNIQSGAFSLHAGARCQNGCSRTRAFLFYACLEATLVGAGIRGFSAGSAGKDGQGG